MQFLWCQRASNTQLQYYNTRFLNLSFGSTLTDERNFKNIYKNIRFARNGTSCIEISRCHNITILTSFRSDDDPKSTRIDLLLWHDLSAIKLHRLE